MKSDGVLANYSFRSNIYVAGCSEYRNPVPAGSAIYGVKHENATAMIDVIRFPKKMRYFIVPAIIVPERRWQF